MSSTPPVPPLQNPALDALRARLATAMRAQANPQAMLRGALEELRQHDWQAWLEYARAFSSVAAPQLAAALLDEATQLWPLNAELRVGLGHALRLSQRNAEAEAAFRHVLQDAPGHEQAALALAFLLRECGRIDAASAVVLDLWERQGKGLEATLKAGAFLEECRRPQWVAQVYETALAQGQRDPRILAAAGDVAMVLGQFELGRQHLLAALDAGLELKDWAGFFMRLANNRRYATADDPDFARFEQAWADPSLDEEVRIASGFALGKARIDIDDYPGAVDVLRQANTMQHRRRPWNASAFKDFVATQISVPLPSVVSVAGFESVIPVFVVGLPRTGTTLVESMLARHPQVRSRGEMNWLPFLNFELTAKRRTNDPAALRQAASIYLTHLRQDDAPARWYIDKNPHNLRYLGLIARLFPHARIVHCARDRRDTAVSIWSQLFAHQDVDYAYAMEDIATFAHGHDRLMDHWRKCLDLPVFELEYERLIDQPGGVLQQIGDFLGLPGQDLVAAESDGCSAIFTASAWQARQPMYRSSVGRWRRFAPYLPELQECFRSA